MLQELGIRNAIYSLENHGPEEELFTIRMRNIVLQMAPTSLFGFLVAILSPHLRHPISEVTCAVADLAEAEAMSTQKEIRSATHKKNLKGPMEVMRMQMWVDLKWADRAMQALSVIDPSRPFELHVYVTEDSYGWGLWQQLE